MTEVTIHVSNMDELKEVLREIQELKRGNPDTRFRIEVS